MGWHGSPENSHLLDDGNIQSTNMVNGTLVSNLFQLSALLTGIAFEIPCHAPEIIISLEASEDCVRLKSDQSKTGATSAMRNKLNRGMIDNRPFVGFRCDHVSSALDDVCAVLSSNLSTCKAGVRTDCQLHLALSADEVLAASHTRIVPLKPHSWQSTNSIWTGLSLDQTSLKQNQSACMLIEACAFQVW
jgi:hypothetical protein